MAETAETDRLSPGERLVDRYLDRFPGEAAAELEQQPLDAAIEFIESLEATRAAQMLERVTELAAADYLPRIDTGAWRKIAAKMDPYRVALLASRLDDEDRDAVLKALDRSLAREIRDILEYPPDTAASIMDTRVLSFRSRTTVEEVLARLRSWHRRDTRYILVTDDDGCLQGLLTLSDVALAPPKQRIENLVEGPAPRVSAMAPQEEVLDALSSFGIGMLPVVDGQERLLGVIRQDAIIQAVKEEATADIATLVGASKDEQALSPASFAVRKRLPWLNINLLTAFLAAAVVGLFEDTIARFTALAVLLPVVAGQSGNTGAQALAVVIRGLALREIRARDARRVLTKELIAGTLNGIAIAVVTVVAVYIWSGSLGLCLVIFLAMIISMAIAGLSGAAIPIILSSLRQDPAQSGSIILTTVTDVFGFFSFLGLATVFASML